MNQSYQLTYQLYRTKVQSFLSLLSIQHQQAIQQKQKQIYNLEQQVQQYKTQINKLTKKSHEYQQSIKSKQQTINTINYKNNQLCKLIEQQNKKISSSNDKNTAEQKKLKDSAEKYENELKIVNQQKTNFEQLAKLQIKQLVDNHHKLSQQLAQCKSELEKQKKKKNDIIEELEKQKKKKNVQEIQSTLHGLLQTHLTPPQYLNLYIEKIKKNSQMLHQISNNFGKFNILYASNDVRNYRTSSLLTVEKVIDILKREEKKIRFALISNEQDQMIRI